MNDVAQDNPAPGVWAGRVMMVGIVAALLLPLGALGSRFGVWDFGIGFMILGAAVLASVTVLVVSLAMLIRSLLHKRFAELASLGLALVVSALVIGVLSMQFVAGTTVPPIHDITTDWVDPPQFDVAVELRGGDSNPLEYLGPEISDQQQQSYPFVQPIVVDMDGDEAFEVALETVRGLGWEVVNNDPERGLIEAVDTTFWFGFKDDVVVRVRPSGAEGSRIDLRSVSRVGASDLGANATRIRAFIDAFAR